MNPLNYFSNTVTQTLTVTQSVNTLLQRSTDNITNTAQQAIGRAQENLNENPTTLKRALNVSLQSANETIGITRAIVSSTFALTNATLEASRSLIGRVQR